MTRYLLDTTALIDFSKGREPTRSRILRLIDTGDEVGVCPINIAEFYAGVPVEKRSVWDGFFAALRYWEISRDAARQAGCYRYEFARSGKVLSTTDTLVAAVARERRAIVMTSNVKDYPMDDVELLPLKD